MEKNQLTGLLLIFGLIVAFMWYNQPSEEELAKQQVAMDSIAQTQVQETIDPKDIIEPTIAETFNEQDSVVSPQMQMMYGDFYASVSGEEKAYFLENEKMKIKFSNQGGRISEVLLKDYKKVTEGPKKEEIKIDLLLGNNPGSKFEYLLPVKTVKDGVISTGDLFFNATQTSDEITFEVRSANGTVIRQIYTLSENDFTVGYKLETENLELLVDRNTDQIELNWVEYLDKLEKNDTFEKTYATLQYKFFEDDTDYCSFTKDDSDDLTGSKLEWVSNSNQFFTSVLMVPKGDFFNGGQMSVKVDEENQDN